MPDYTLSADDQERQNLIGALEAGQGTLEQEEQWLQRLQDIDPYFGSSDRMHYLEIAVKARRLYNILRLQLGEPLHRSQLVTLVEQLCNAQGSEAEEHAWLMLIQSNVPDPNISNLIYYPEEPMTAEEIVDRALAYQPIILGPAI